VRQGIAKDARDPVRGDSFAESEGPRASASSRAHSSEGRNRVLRLCSVKNRPRAQNENWVFSIARTRCRKRNVLCFQFAVVFPSCQSRTPTPEWSCQSLAGMSPARANAAGGHVGARDDPHALRTA
jgi:hypothetical protein